MTVKEIKTEDDLINAVNERLDKMVREAGFDSLEEVKKINEKNEAYRAEAAQRAAEDQARRAEEALPADLRDCFKRALDRDTSVFGPAGHANEEVGLAGLRSFAALRLRHLAQQSGRPLTGEGLAETAREMERRAETSQDRKYYETLARAASAGVLGTGGSLIPEDFRSDLVALYTAQTVIRKNATLLPMPAGNMTMPRETSATAPGYVAENENATTSVPGVDQLKLSSKKQRVVTPVSNDLLRFAGPVADVWLRNRIATDSAVAEDASMIRGVGSEGTIKGLRYQALAANVSARTQSGATSTLAEIVDDLYDMFLDLAANNVPFSTAWRWLGSPAVVSGAGRRLNSNGFFVFGDSPMMGTLLGLGIDQTTSVPANLGGGDESEIYLINYADVAVGDVSGLEVEFVRYGTYHDGSTVISGISADQSVFAATMRSDIGLLHDAAVSIRTAVDWTDV